MEEQQEQSNSFNKMAQRRSFEEVLLSPWQPGARRHHWNMKVPTEAAAAMVMAEMFNLFVLDLQIAELHLTYCKINPKGFKRKIDNNVIHLPASSPGHFILGDSFSCGLGFAVLFLMKSNLRLQRGLSSHLLHFINIW